MDRKGGLRNTDPVSKVGAVSPQSCYLFLIFEAGVDKSAHNKKGVGSGEEQEEA